MSRRNPWTPRDRFLTEETIYWQRNLYRREFLKSIGWSVAGIASLGGISGCGHPTLEELDAAGKVETALDFVVGPRNPEFEYGRPETDRAKAAEYTNFYEFTTSKAVYKYVQDFQPVPWSVEVAGLCRNPRRYDLDDIYREFRFEERAYRFRCVETWAMCVPWAGFPLSELIRQSDPSPAAKYLRFSTFHDRQLTAQMGYSEYPWPYTESLTLAEAANQLSFVAVGIYGRPLPKQHGAPVRLVLPWKYGFKSIKSIVKIEFTADPPATFWNTLNPHEYDTVANVDPAVPHPRWSQEFDRMLGTGEIYPTQKYNGYGDYVASLYL